MMLVVFDLDGTLVDSRQDLADSTNAVLESYGAPALPRDRVAGMVGDGARALVQRALIAAGVGADLDEALARFHDSYRPRVLATTRPYAGISETVAAVRAVASLAVLTNKPLAPTMELIAAFGWTSHFIRVIGGDGDMPRKPDPAGLLALVALAGATPETTMLVGDSMIDVETARRAGTAICVAQYGFGTARGDLELRGDEWLAESGHDVGRMVTRWLEQYSSQSR
jgi:phosphoglycolate phosphatase